MERLRLAKALLVAGCLALRLECPSDGRQMTRHRSALRGLGRKVVTWRPAEQDADEQHEPDEGRARVAVAEQYRPQHGGRAYRSDHSGQRYGSRYRAVQQVAGQAGRAAPPADGRSAADGPGPGSGYRRDRRTARVLACKFIHAPSLVAPRSVRFTVDARETAAQKVDKDGICARFRVSACDKRQSAVGFV